MGARVPDRLWKPLAGAGIFAALGACGCAGEAPPRPQLVVVVDIDVPLPIQLNLNGELSGDTAVDTLRVDAFHGDTWSQPYDLRDFIAPTPDDWPLSFGVAADEVSLDQPVHLRLRAFRGRLASRGMLDGGATIEPPADVSIDRLITVMPPAEGIRRIRVTLHGDCLGVYNTFDVDPSKVRTCLDGDHRQAEPGEGITELAEGDGGPTLAGSWPGALAIPCAGKAPAGIDAVCIPGGFSVLGNLTFEGVGDGLFDLDPTPLRPVQLSPFFMDRTEITVKALRDLLQDPTKDLTGVAPVMKGDPNISDSGYCTWLGPSDASNDALPLNCLRRQDAAAICAARGGKLPSEARWEHAARGRGRGSLYPWGDHEPDPTECCITSVGRAPSPNSQPAACPGSGVEPAGSHPTTDACSGRGDESRDGVLDLAGSLGELVADSFVPFSAPCWLRGTGALKDPVCIDDSTVEQVVRGGNWNAGVSTVAAPFRHVFNGQRPTSGFRCVYEDGGP